MEGLTLFASRSHCGRARCSDPGGLPTDCVPDLDLSQGGAGARPAARAARGGSGSHGSPLVCARMAAVVIPHPPLFLLECGLLLCPNKVIHMSIHLDRHGAADWRK